MGLEENDNNPVSLIESSSSEISEVEPIEQVFSQETDDSSASESP